MFKSLLILKSNKINIRMEKNLNSNEKLNSNESIQNWFYEQICIKQNNNWHSFIVFRKIKYCT